MSANDVFYFGNAIGDFSVGNIGAPLFVRTNASDTGTVRQLGNQSPNPNSVPVTNVFDINKDGRVNAADIALVRQNQNARIITYFTAPLLLQLFAENDLAGFPAIDLGFGTKRENEAVVQVSQTFRFSTNSFELNRGTTPTKLDNRQEWITSGKSAKSSSRPNDPRSVDTVFASCLDKIVA